MRDKFLDTIHERKEGVERKILGGSANNFEDYRYSVAYVNALNEVLDLYNELYNPTRTD